MQGETWANRLIGLGKAVDIRGSVCYSWGYDGRARSAYYASPETAKANLSSGAKQAMTQTYILSYINTKTDSEYPDTTFKTLADIEQHIKQEHPDCTSYGIVVLCKSA